MINSMCVFNTVMTEGSSFWMHWLTSRIRKNLLIMCWSSPGSRSSTGPRAPGSSGQSAPGPWLSSVGSSSWPSWDHWECRPSSPGCILLSGWCCMRVFSEMSCNPHLVGPPPKYKKAKAKQFAQGLYLLEARGNVTKKHTNDVFNHAICAVKYTNSFTIVSRNQGSVNP